MSLAFNDTTTRKGIVQILEKECGFSYGAISGDTSRLKDAAADINLAFDDYFAIAIPASGKWQLDDSGHTKQPTIRTNMVADQREYSFLTDEDGNLILDIHRVFARISSTGVFQELMPVDKQSGEDVDSFHDGLNITGVPERYDKTGPTIFLDPIPSYNSTLGLKLEINREASYFAYTDTTKKPGVPGIHHRYFAIKPALDYSRQKDLANYNRLLAEVDKMEAAIKAYFGGRARDERNVLRGKKVLHM